MTWTAAEAYAQSIGGHLVTVRSREEMNWLVATFGVSQPLWIGFSDARFEGHWAWSSGEPVVFTNWASGQPDNGNCYGGGGQDYAMLGWACCGEWDDQINEGGCFAPPGPGFRGIVEIIPPTTHVVSIGLHDDVSQHGGEIIAQHVTDAMSPWVPSWNRTTIGLNTASSLNPTTALRSALQVPAARLRPGDTAIIYVNGHGGADTSGDEVPVEREYIQRWPFGMRTREMEISSGHEYLRAGAGDTGKIYDDAFASLFSGPQWDGVTKLFVMDTCYAGGYRASVGALPRAALIAASPEGRFSKRIISPAIDPNWWVGTLGSNLVRFLEGSAFQCEFSFRDMFDFLKLAGTESDGTPGRIQDPPEGWDIDMIITSDPRAWVAPSFRSHLLRPCLADVEDGSNAGLPDGGVTIEDLLYFLDRFQTGSVDADMDDGSGTATPDGGVTIDDLLYYLQRYLAGC